MVHVLDIFTDFLRVNLYEPKGCKALPQALHEMILLTMLIDFHVSALSCCYRLEPEDCWQRLQLIESAKPPSGQIMMYIVFLQLKPVSCTFVSQRK